MLPEYPAIHPEVAARQHHVGGETRVSLTHTALHREIVIGPREWDTLRCADGTRDLTGIQRALQRRGRRVSLKSLEGFLTQLHDLGMLSSDALPSTTPTSQRPAEQSRPLRPLDGYQFRCGGQGHCCETYTSILFTPVEELRAREACPEILDGEYSRERLFSPERGAHDIGASCVTRVEGGCAYFAAGVGCQIHHRRGPDAKPNGCQLFPLRYVDDGVDIHLTVRPECACVFDSIDHQPPERTDDDAPSTSADLPAWVPVERLPEQIQWSPDETITLETFRTRRDAWLQNLPDDLAPALWTFSDTEKPSADSLADGARPYLQAIHDRLDTHHTERMNWDAPEGHMMRSIRRWRDALATWLKGETHLPETGIDAHERFAIRALAMGTTLTEADSVGDACRRIALLIWSARLLEAESIGMEPVSHPLALTFSVTTALGLWEELLR